MLLVILTVTREVLLSNCNFVGLPRLGDQFRATKKYTGRQKRTGHLLHGTNPGIIVPSHLPVSSSSYRFFFVPSYPTKSAYHRSPQKCLASRLPASAVNALAAACSRAAARTTTSRYIAVLAYTALAAAAVYASTAVYAGSTAAVAFSR